MNTKKRSNYDEATALCAKLAVSSGSPKERARFRRATEALIGSAAPSLERVAISPPLNMAANNRHTQLPPGEHEKVLASMGIRPAKAETEPTVLEDGSVKFPFMTPSQARAARQEKA